MRTKTGLALLLIASIGMSGCRETPTPFETIDAIATIERADLHGQLGHLIRIQSAPKRQGGDTTTVYAKVLDKDISDTPYFVQWWHTSFQADDYLSKVTSALSSAENLTLVSKIPRGLSPNEYEEIVIGKPGTTAEWITHYLKITKTDGSTFYLELNIAFTNTVKRWFAAKLSQPLRIFILEEKEDDLLPKILFSALPNAVRTTVTKDDDGSSTVALPGETVSNTPTPKSADTLDLKAYRVEDVIPTTAPPAITAFNATSDNADTTKAVTGDTVTITFTTNKPIVTQQSQITFTTEDGTHNSAIRTMTNATNRYTAQLRITDTMATGALQVSITMVDADSHSVTITRDTAVTISEPVEPPLEPVVHADPQHWRANTDITARWLTQYSNSVHGVVQERGLSNAEILDWYRAGLPGFLNSIGIDGIGEDFDFILYELYSICVEVRPEIAADAERTGILVHPIANNRLVFDWVRLGFAYPEKSKGERSLLFRRLVRFWGAEDPEDWWWRTAKIGINELNWATIVPEGNRVYLQPPANPFLTATERRVRKELEQMSQTVQGFLMENPDAPVIKIYNAMLSSRFSILVDLIFTDLWNIYQEEQPAQAANIAVDDIPLHPISGNGLLFAWLVLQYDNPGKSKDERLALFRQLARQGKVQPILEE